jgi:hypothetical protein
MTNRIIYFVEGECEEALINALKMQPSLVYPGKVRKHNVIQNLIPKSILLSIKPKTQVVFVFDTDVKRVDILRKNIERIKKYCSQIMIVHLMQVFNFEDEIVRSTDVKKAQDLTKSKSLSNFKHDFGRMNPKECRQNLKRHRFDIHKIWVTKPRKDFSNFEQNGGLIKK